LGALIIKEKLGISDNYRCPLWSAQRENQAQTQNLP
jgi:hypothetical protein